MKKQKTRKKQKFLKSIAKRFLWLCLGLFTAGWLVFHYEDAAALSERFTVAPLETREIDTVYDLLSQYRNADTELMLDLDGTETNELEAVMKKLRDAMGLKKHSIKLAEHDKKVPPGYIEAEGDRKTIYLSSHLKNRREQITVLIHELGHIYVWSLPQNIFMAFDQEKLVDISCMFLGMGALYLNGMTDDFKVRPDGAGYQSEQKNFGYLKPEQFGYLLARYRAEHAIPEEVLSRYLTPAGWKHYQAGNAYFKRKTEGIVIPKPILQVRSAIRKFLGILNIKISDTVVIR